MFTMTYTTTRMDWLNYIAPHPRIVGSVADERQHVSPRRVIYDHELMLFAGRGSYEINFDNQSLLCTDNMYVILPPGVWHTTRGMNLDNCFRAWMHFDWVYDQRSVPERSATYAPADPEPEEYHMAPSVVPKEIMYGRIDNPKNIFALHRRMQDCYASPHRRNRSRALLLELLLDLLGPQFEGGNANVGICENSITAVGIRDALGLMAQMPFAEAPPLQAYLSKRGQSYDHQARVFKKSYGISPLQYVNALRIEEACCLLRDTTLKIGVIADRLGYTDCVYFGRSFKKILGKTPQAYRKYINQ